MPSTERGPTFTGTVWAEPLLRDVPGVVVNTVFFPPGARTHWHRHETGQILLVTHGSGLAFNEGGDGGVIMPGDVVWFDPGERHWHGGRARHLRQPHRDLARHHELGGGGHRRPVRGGSEVPLTYGIAQSEIVTGVARSGGQGRGGDRRRRRPRRRVGAPTGGRGRAGRRRGHRRRRRRAGGRGDRRRRGRGRRVARGGRGALPRRGGGAVSGGSTCTTSTPASPVRSIRCRRWTWPASSE